LARAADLAVQMTAVTVLVERLLIVAARELLME
jgi:hypothetical protein